MSEPARPSSEDENAVPMPFSGAARPAFRSENMVTLLGVAGVDGVDGAADRLDGLEQAPEGAEQAEEHQEADHVAAGVARLIEARADGIHDRAQRRGGKRQHARAVAQHRRHRRQQHRLMRYGKARIGDAEGVDPADLRIEPRHLPEGIEDAERQHTDDQPVEARIVHEAVDQLLVQDGRQEGDEGEEDQHADEEDARRRQRPMAPAPPAGSLCRLLAINELRCPPPLFSR